MCLGTHGHAVPVHIPFDIGNVGALQHAGDIFHNVIPHFLLCQVQQQLMAAVNGGESVGQCPVGMRAVKIRILVDGLRLKPQAKFHTHLVDLPDKSIQPLGQLL